MSAATVLMLYQTALILVVMVAVVLIVPVIFDIIREDEDEIDELARRDRIDPR